MEEVFSIGWGREEERSTATEVVIKKNENTVPSSVWVGK